MTSGLTYYSKQIKGARGNYEWPVRFDRTDGYVGISQWADGRATDRILLSPKQVKELLSFVRKRPSK